MKPYNRYLFRCECGDHRRLTPDNFICSFCKEPMEFVAVLKYYPGFGMGRITVRTFFKGLDKHSGRVI